MLASTYFSCIHSSRFFSAVSWVAWACEFEGYLFSTIPSLLIIYFSSLMAGQGVQPKSRTFMRMRLRWDHSFARVHSNFFLQNDDQVLVDRAFYDLRLPLNAMALSAFNEAASQESGANFLVCHYALNPGSYLLRPLPLPSCWAPQ